MDGCRIKHLSSVLKPYSTTTRSLTTPIYSMNIQTKRQNKTHSQPAVSKVWLAVGGLVLCLGLGCQSGRQSMAIVPSRVVPTNHQNEESADAATSPVVQTKGLAEDARSVPLETAKEQQGTPSTWSKLWGHWGKPKSGEASTTESIPLPLSQAPAESEEGSSSIQNPSEAPAGLLLDEF